MMSLSADKDIETIEAFNSMSRYLDDVDVLNLNIYISIAIALDETSILVALH